MLGITLDEVLWKIDAALRLEGGIVVSCTIIVPFVFVSRVDDRQKWSTQVERHNSRKGLHCPDTDTQVCWNSL
jgi:arylamine N-acetyltransferase